MTIAPTADAVLAPPLAPGTRLGDAFESLVSPLNKREFFLRYWGKDYFVGHGSPDRFASLFSWEALSEILSTHRFEFPRLRLLSGGRVAPPSQYIMQKIDRRGNPFTTHDASAVGRMLNDGAMLHITSIGETWKPLADFAAQIEREVGGKVQVNLHAGYAGSRGFHTHWDGHDVYAAQIDGSKTWRLFGITEEAPLAVPPDEKHGSPSEHVWEGVVGLGDMLYLPRGYWHATEYRADPSLHLTFAVQHPNGAEFVQWLLQLLAEDPRARRDIPLPIFDIQEVGDASIRQFIEDLRTLVMQSMSYETMRKYIDEYRASLGSANHVQLVPQGRSRHGHA